MKVLVIILSLCIVLLANDKEDGFNSKFVPMISSNPNSGTSLGIMNAMVYDTDANSSTSQALLMAQYSDTDSWSIVGLNKSFFDSNKYRFVLLGAYIHNNSELSLTTDIPLPEISQDFQGDAQFQVDIFFTASQLLYEFYPNIYIGGQVLYRSAKFEPKNDAGKLFMLLNGMENSNNAAIGLTASYDTRSLDEKIYPRDATWIDFIVNNYPSTFGSKEDYTSVQLNARKYIKGFKPSDVWANQFFGKYSSDDAPDSGLAALGTRNILRGFAIGQYKAKYMSAFQSEYRYELDGTAFKFVGFAGIASLNGGSKGRTIGNVNFSRKDDGIYSSVGIGARYALQKDAGVDYRVDFAYTSTNDYGLYATVNQAF